MGSICLISQVGDHPRVGDSLRDSDYYQRDDNNQINGDRLSDGEYPSDGWGVHSLLFKEYYNDHPQSIT